MSASVARATGEFGSRALQIPEHQLANDARPVMAIRGGGGQQVIPDVLLQPNASDLVRRFIRHGRGVYGPYVRCDHVCEQAHGCSVCPMYVRCQYLSSTKAPIRLDSSGGSRRNRIPLRKVAPLMMTANAPNCIPTTVVCHSCGALFTAYGPHDGLCPRRSCSVPGARHADLDLPQPCWTPGCTTAARYVVEWFGSDARRETCCAAHFETLFEYATDTSDGFTRPQVELVPLAERLSVAA